MLSEQAKVVVEYGPEQLTAVTRTLLQSMICESIARHGICRIALSGGTTPRALYQHLAADVVRGEVPWKSVQFFFGDERDVPHDNVESNYHMAQRTLLDHLPVEPGNVYPMPADRENLDEGAAQYEQTIREIVPAGPDGIPSFDILLLGIGGDGHTASLFPNTEVLQESKKLVAAYFVPVLGRHRMTFTFPLINAAKAVVFLISGDDKADVMKDILAGSPEAETRYPAARVKPRGTLIYAMDSAAAKFSAYAMK